MKIFFYRYGYLLALLLTAYFWAVHTSFNHPVSDHFHLIRFILIPYVNQDLAFSDFFIIRNPADHLFILYKLVLILNYHIFDLDTRMELLFGFLGYIVCCLMIFQSFRQSIPQESKEKSHFVYALFVILISTKLVSFNEIVQFNWPMVTFLSWKVFFALITFYISERVILHKKSPKTLLLITPFTIILGGAYGLLAAISSIVAFSFFAFIKRDKTYYKVSTLLLAILLLCSLAISIVINPLNSNTISANHSLISIDGFKFFIHSFSQGMISITHFPKTLTKENLNLSLLIGITIMLINGYIFYAYFRNKTYQRSVFPMLLLLWSYGFMVAVFWVRFPQFGLNYAFQPRYVHFLEYNIIAVIWIAALHLIDHVKTQPGRAISRATVAIGLVFVLMHMSFIVKAFNHSKWIIKYHKQEEQQIRLMASGDIELGNLPSVKIHGAKEVAVFLKEHQLSLFKGEW